MMSSSKCYWVLSHSVLLIFSKHAVLIRRSSVEACLSHPAQCPAMDTYKHTVLCVLRYLKTLKDFTHLITVFLYFAIKQVGKLPNFTMLCYGNYTWTTVILCRKIKPCEKLACAIQWMKKKTQNKTTCTLLKCPYVDTHTHTVYSCKILNNATIYINIVIYIL